MKDVLVQCKDSASAVTLGKEKSVASISSRLVNLQTAGANLISLGEGKKKGSVRGRKRKLIRSDSSGATEFSLKQTLTILQTLYSEYKAALEGKKVVTEGGIGKKTDKKVAPKKEEKKVIRRTTVLGKTTSVEPQVDVGKVLNELKIDSSAKKEIKETRVRGQQEGKSTERRSTIGSRSAARHTLKARKLQSEDTTFQRSYTLPGHFHGRRVSGLSVLEKAAAFSQVTEGTGLAAPFGLNTTSARTRTRRASLEEWDLKTRKFEARQKMTTQEKTIAATEPVKPVKTVVQTAVVRTVIKEQEPAKRVSLVNIDVDVKNPPTTERSLSPSISPGPFKRVVSPSSTVLHSEREPPPRVISPVTSPVINRSNTKSPVTTVPVSLSSRAASRTVHQRRSIQNLKISGKVSHLKHVFDRQDEEGGGSMEKSRNSPSPSPKSKVVKRFHSPDIVPKIPEQEQQVVTSEPLMADRPFPSPDIAPKENSEAELKVEPPVDEVERERIYSLAPSRPEPPPNYSSATPSPENPPPRPPSPIGYVLEKMSDVSEGESSYQSYDSEEEEEEEGEEEIDGGVEDVDSGTIARRTVKTLQYVKLPVYK